LGQIFDREHEPPEPTPGDTGAAVVRSVLGAFPVLGQAAQELFQRVIAPPLVRRQQEWMNDVAEALRRLETDGRIDFDAIRDNPAFIDTMLSASQQAVRTSQQAKRDALRNAVVNSALPSAPDATKQQMFLGLIDRCTDWHLRILKLFADPAKEFRAMGLDPNFAVLSSSLSQTLEHAIPELRGQRQLYDLVWADLFAAGLVNSQQMHTMMTPQGAMSCRTSDFGNEFLAFISDT
jgi:hypothetical protein